MPDQPSWYQRIPQILKILETTSLPVLDRYSVEKLFGVGRRQAVRIMARLGGYQAGRTSLIERDELAQRLRLLAGGVSVERAVGRRQRIWQILRGETSRLRALGVTITPPQIPPRLANLPAGVDLRPGRLVVTYTEPIQLLERLYALAQALTVDYENFEKSFGGSATTIVLQ